MSLSLFRPAVLSICVGLAFVLFSTPAASGEEDDEVRSFIDESWKRSAVWLSHKVPVRLGAEEVFGRRLGDSTRPVIDDIRDIDWTGGVEVRGNRKDLILKLVADGYLDAELRQEEENRAARQSAIESIRDFDQEVRERGFALPLPAQFEAVRGFEVELSLGSDASEAEAVRQTSNGYFYSIGEPGNYRVITLQRDSSRDRCDWQARVRVWIDEPSRFANEFMMVTGRDYIEFENCYRWDREGLEWVYMRAQW